MLIARRSLVLMAVVTALVVAVLAHQDDWDHWRSLLVRPSEERFPIRGVDVSHHQGAIDWRQVRASGHSFAFIKASEGADFRDTRFDDNWHGARAAGLATGAYHFFTFCSPGDAQANNFLAAIPPGAHVLPPSIDVEFTGNCTQWDSVATIQRELRVFVERGRVRVRPPAAAIYDRRDRARAHPAGTLRAPVLDSQPLG